LETCIDSILRQTYDNVEVLLCDDCSSDNSWQILEKYKELDKRIQIFKNDENLGVSLTRNLLIENARGEYVMMQDADDFSDPERVERQLAFLKTNPDYVGCCTQFRKVIGDKIVYESNYPTTWQEVKKVIPNSFPWICAGLMIKKEILLKYGAYNRFFSKTGFEDHYLISSIVLNEKLTNIPEALYNYRYNPNSITKSFRYPNLQKVIINKVGVKLIEQQLQSGRDVLQDANINALDQLINELKAPYISDPSRIFREMAEKSWYWNERNIAIYLAIKALLKSPFNTSNTKLLIYLIWKSLSKQKLSYES